MPKLVAVVGGKHSGKTTVIEHLLAELKSSGYCVAVVKEMVRIPMLDTPATETGRYSEAGAEIIVALPRQETVIFVKRQLSIKEILSYLPRIDFVILEGFEREPNLPKIIAAKTSEEIEKYMDDRVFAISGLITGAELEIKKAKQCKIPMLKSKEQARELVDLIEHKALSA